MRHAESAPFDVTSARATFFDDGYRQLYDFAPVMWLVLDVSANILEVNAAGAAMLGATPGFIRGTPLRIWVHADWRSALTEHIRHCRTTDEAVETSLQLKSRGDALMVRLVSRRTMFHDRIVFPSVAIDISDRESLDAAGRTAERQRDIAEGERQLARAGEAAKDRLIAMVSHELRNPLSPALMAASTLTTWRDLPAGARELAAVIKRNIQLEARLIDDLLDVARVTRGQLDLRMRVIDLHAILEHAIEASQAAARERNVTIISQLHADPHYVRADETRLEQVFWNLIANAVKFSDAGGQVILRTKCNENGVLVVAVRDYGAGMEADTLQHLFTPFEKPRTPTNGRAGLGLGLTIARSIVEQHGGQIWARSEGAGRGSVFEVELAPCLEEPRPEDLLGIVAASGPVPDASPSRGRVLIVEDHADTGELLSTCLSQRGYEVQLAKTLSAGLAALDSGWDAVLSDIGLGDGSGLEIARHAANGSRRPGLLVALSGYGADADIEASRRAGFDAHLVKPIDLTRLLRVLEGTA